MSEATRPAVDLGPLSPVEAYPDGERWTLVFVRELAHAPPPVWTALTDPEVLREWAPFQPDRSLATVGPATLTMIDGAHSETFASEVLRAEPPTGLDYRWGEDLLSWRLQQVEGGTRLRLQHTVQARDWLPKVAAGWHLCLVVAELWLRGTPVGPIVGEQARKHGWEQLNTAYAERLGVEDSGWPLAPSA